MEFNDYLRRAAETEQVSDQAEALRIGLYGIAGEAGSVVSEAKKWVRAGESPPGLEVRVAEELGDLLWYVATVARHLNLDLDQVAEANLRKNAEIWPDGLPDAVQYDAEFVETMQLPRQMHVRFEEDASFDPPIVRMVPLGPIAERIERERERKQIGDELDDNAARDDGYRFHDVIHLAHAAVLGWSPVLRALIGAKRKADSNVDRVQDGARAVAIEEGLAAFVFNFAEERGFLRGARRVDWDLIKHVRRTVRGLEVADQPPIAWQEAYLQAFAAFRDLRAANGGVVECDLDVRRIKVMDDDK